MAPVHQSSKSTLTPEGETQAEKIAARALSLNFDVLISSPYPRARYTAEKIGRITGKLPEFSDLFIERKKPSSIEGVSLEDKRANAVFQEWHRGFYISGSRVEDAENYEQLINRADLALDFIAQREEENLLVVTHGIFLRTMIARILLGEELTPQAHHSLQNHATMANTGITTLQYFEDDKLWNLWTYNDLAHLGEER